MQLKGKLWLFWRGGGWNPTFSYTRNGRDWVPAASSCARSTRSDRTPSTSATGTAASTASSPRATPTTSTTASTTCATRTRTSSGPAGGGWGAYARCLPIHKLERVYRFTKATGSAWPHDIALTAQGRPRIVYTRRVGHHDTFFYCIRPVTPRGLTGSNLVLFSVGDRTTRGFTDFRTRIHFLAGATPPV
jgi:hypothetical protein